MQRGIFSRWVRLLSSIAAVVAIGSAQAMQIEMPAVSGPIPVTADSQIYGAADVPGAGLFPNLASRGYVEEEYFLSGKANVYGYDDKQRLVLKEKDVPYTTQMIVRRPKDPAKFSGNVQFEAMHPSYGLTPTWSATHDYIMRHGDVYVALGVGGDAVTRQVPSGVPPLALPSIVKWFDAKRYAPIQWPDEDGIRWDVIVQASKLLRSKDKANPLAAYNVDRVYASGWSYTGSLWRTFINEGFDRYWRRQSVVLFDGYLIGMSTGTFIGGYLPIGSGTAVLPEDHQRRKTRSTGAPVIELLSENEALTNLEPAMSDGDELTMQHRLYEVAGISHGDGLYDGDVSKAPPLTLQLRAHGYPSGNRSLAPSGCDLRRSDVPMAHLAIAALSNLDRWARDNVPPPRAERVTIKPGATRTERDENDNPRSGVRTAQLDVPLAKYATYQGDDRPQCKSSGRYVTVWRQPLEKAKLAMLYKNKEDYLAKFKARLEQLVRERWILAPEAEKELTAARAAAREAFE